MANKVTKIKRASSSAAEQTEETSKATLTKLRAELEAERKINRQLRREKANEVQQVRDQEQTKASISLKDLATKLHQERQQEVELQKETLRCKLESDNGKVIKVKDQEIRKLKQDLAKCQNELKEEVTKRGLSTSARGTFESERNRLLQEVKELNAAKKQLEGALQAASEAEKRKNLEIRQLQDNCKLELAKIEREANLEVKKLLEELKTKDHMLAMHERNSCTDKASMLKGHVENLSIEELLNLSRELERQSAIPECSGKDATEPCTSGAALQTISLHKKLYDMEKQIKFANGLHRALVDKNNTLASSGKQLEEKIKQLSERINALNCERQLNKAEIGRLNDVIVSMKSENVPCTQSQLEICQQQYYELQQILASVRHDGKEKDRRIALLVKSQHNQRHKYEPKTVRFLLPDLVSSNEDVSEENNSSELSAKRRKRDYDETDGSDELLLQSMHKDYEMLMEEHLKLEKYCATIIQSQNEPQQSSVVQKESLDVVVLALENKLKQSEEQELQLRHQVQEVCDQNEELEFRILELEECTEGTKSTFYEKEEVELMDKNRQLETQVIRLKQKLARYESIDISELEKDVDPTPEAADIATNPVDQQTRLSVENLRKLSASLSGSDDDNPMVQSFSTMTSGFDEISCRSLEFDDKADVSEYPTLPEEGLVEEDCAQEEVTDISEKQPEQNLAVDTNSGTSPLLLSKEECTANGVNYNTRPVDDLVTTEDMNVIRIKGLQEQVDILERSDSKYLQTIEMLDNIEKELQTVSEDQSETDLSLPHNSSNQSEFWTLAKNEVGEAITLVQTTKSETASGNIPIVSTLYNEAHVALDSSMTRLQKTNDSLCSENKICQNLDAKIRGLEETADNNYEQNELCKRFKKIEQNTSQNSTATCDAVPIGVDEVLSPVKSLKKCAVEVVINCFQEDFKELKTLSKTFLMTSVNDDESETGNSDNSTNVGSRREKHSRFTEARNELRLNTKLSCVDQRFDFLSPTSFETEWVTDSHMETENQCLLQQVRDLEKERDMLQELVYKDDNIISEMSQQMCEMDQSEKALQELVERLETAERKTRARVAEINDICSQLRVELQTSKSSEQDLKIKCDLLESSEADKHMKLQTKIELQESTEVKLKHNLTQLEQEKHLMEIRVEELSNLVCTLETKENNLKQQLKRLESSDSKSKEKVNELEFSINSAYDEVGRVSKQRDSLIQRVALLEDDNLELSRENGELIEDKIRMTSEVDRLTESECFLKEANRKMWLSLQANLVDRNGDSGKRPRQTESLARSLDDVSNLYPSVQSSMTAKPEQIDETVQTTVGDQQSTLVIQNSAIHLKKAIHLLGTKYPLIHAEFFAAAIGVPIDNTASVEENIEEMQKFISKMQFKCSSSFEPSTLKLKHFTGDDVPNTQQKTTVEENFWSLVEDPQDLFDMRAAETAEYWNHLEEIMGVNTADLGMSMVLKKKPTTATDSSVKTKSLDSCLLQAVPSYSTVEPDPNTSAPPPLPSTSPPLSESSEPADLAAVQGDMAQTDCVESADEASEIHDEDDGALPRLPLPRNVTSRTVRRSRRIQSAGVVGAQHEDVLLPSIASQLSGNIGCSTDSIADSGLESMLDKSQVKKSQTEFKPVVGSKVLLSKEDDAAILRTQLKEKEDVLASQTTEVDRLREEMRRWQEKAEAAAEEAASLAAALAAARAERPSCLPYSGGESVEERGTMNKQVKKSRLESQVSQIPVSVRQTVDHYRTLSEKSASESPSSPRRSIGSSPTNHQQGSVHASHSSLPSAAAAKLPSNIPRLVWEKYTVSVSKKSEERSLDESEQEKDSRPGLHTAADPAAIEAVATATATQTTGTATEATSDATGQQGVGSLAIKLSTPERYD